MICEIQDGALDVDIEAGEATWTWGRFWGLTLLIEIELDPASHQTHLGNVRTLGGKLLSQRHGLLEARTFDAARIALRPVAADIWRWFDYDNWHTDQRRGLYPPPTGR